MINLGFIGCGDVAFRTYFPGVQSHLDRSTVTACFDVVADRAERAAALFPGATAYTSFDEFLAHPGLDAVFNLTPAPLHRETTTKALDAGLHVLSEKPIAASVEEGVALIEHAKRKKRLLLVAPAIMATTRFGWLRQLLDAGQIGQPTLATAQMANMGPAGWRGYTGDPAVFYTAGVGPLLDTGVYVLHGITGLYGPAKRVQAFGSVAIPKRKVLIPRLAGQEIEVKVNDVMLVHLDFGGNRYAQVLSSYAVPASKASAMELHGSMGTINIEMGPWFDGNGPVNIYRRDESSLGLDGWTLGVRPPNTSGSEDILAAGIRHFLDCLTGAAQPILTAEHACHVLEIILKATESATAGRALELETAF
ncbi:MAG: Gfo/Idh/MocA family protein [Thermomicrobiales bacterium]